MHEKKETRKKFVHKSKVETRDTVNSGHKRQGGWARIKVPVMAGIIE